MERWYTWPTTVFMSGMIGACLVYLLTGAVDRPSHWLLVLVGYPAWALIRNALFPLNRK